MRFERGFAIQSCALWEDYVCLHALALRSKPTFPRLVPGEVETKAKTLMGSSLLLRHYVGLNAHALRRLAQTSDRRLGTHHEASLRARLAESHPSVACSPTGSLTLIDAAIALLWYAMRHRRSALLPTIAPQRLIQLFTHHDLQSRWAIQRTLTGGDDDTETLTRPEQRLAIQALLNRAGRTRCPSPARLLRRRLRANARDPSNQRLRRALYPTVTQ
jgi:hypothetical protein